MSNKSFLKILVAFGLLAMLLVFLGVNYVPRMFASSSAKENTLNTASYAGSDWIERHPSVAAKAVNYAGSDWIERHPSVAANAVNYAGSDWVERHPSVAAKAVNYAGSDWIERHPAVDTSTNAFDDSNSLRNRHRR